MSQLDDLKYNSTRRHFLSKVFRRPKSHRKLPVIAAVRYIQPVCVFERRSRFLPSEVTP